MHVHTTACPAAYLKCADRQTLNRQTMYAGSVPLLQRLRWATADSPAAAVLNASHDPADACWCSSFVAQQTAQHCYSPSS
jgi:hypothetical protein